ncbi:hypothetical protein COL8621_00007 [Actibacterium lipolyticum]|uniref:Uncharacterized protein n=1 Tax=Actibacterium lipolyticum TaxID=1524263 RepID=A0A238JLH9_9RHOB|nr:hypothetical protein COL8621_00007 [Actibacterium lipolyticum]
MPTKNSSPLTRSELSDIFASDLGYAVDSAKQNSRQRGPFALARALFFGSCSAHAAGGGAKRGRVSNKHG